MPPETPRRKPHRITLYIDDRGEYRWKRQAGNARIVAASTEGYTTKAAMVDNMVTANADQLACLVVDKAEGRNHLTRGARQ